uniref:DUF7054 domain-containing protein n=2 Tax=Rhizophora mucronata TaxID=61149 RepID=A0A2P2ILL9_RHIMU
MSERNIRRRGPATGGGRRSRIPHAHPSPRRTATPPRRSGKQLYYCPKPVRILNRCLSEPKLRSNSGVGCGSESEDRQRRRSLWCESESEGGDLYRPHTCTDIFSASPLLAFSPRSQSFEGYNNDAKVVVNVAVEGSPGPVKTMVKLGSSVEDTIKIVLEKYGEEGRTPKLDRVAAASYELHHSYFSLQCLDKSELIGDIGSRSFYLRRNSSGHSANGASNSFSSGIVSAEANHSSPPVPLPPLLLPSFIARKLGKIARKVRMIRRIFVCWQ